MTTAPSTFLVDSNIIVYAFDRSEPEKRAIAEEVVERLLASGRGALNVQVLGEFFNAVTKKIKRTLMPAEAAAIVGNLALVWPVLNSFDSTVLEAVRSSVAHQLSYYDALLLSSARLNLIPYVLSEDMQDGRNVDGVTIMNPLSASFDLSLLD